MSATAFMSAEALAVRIGAELVLSRKSRLEMIWAH
jgi:hypothetical protein